MNSTVFSNMLNSLGLTNASNKWIRLAPQVTMIMLANDSREYPDRNTFYYFDSENNKLYTSSEHTKDEEITGTKLSDYKITNIYCIDYIDGLIRTSVPGPYGSFYTRYF